MLNRSSRDPLNRDLDGSGVSTNHSKRAAKLSFRVPMDVMEFSQHLRNMQGLCQVVFGQKADITAGLTDWLEHSSTHQSDYEVRQHNNKRLVMP